MLITYTLLCSLSVLQLTLDKSLHRDVPDELRGENADSAAGTGSDLGVVLTVLTDQVAVHTMEDLLGRKHHLQANRALKFFLQSGVLTGMVEPLQL